MPPKNKKDDGLDTETTFADMNIEGMRGYDSSKKQQKGLKPVRQKLTRKEYWKMVRSAFVMFLPYLAFFLLVMGFVVVLAYIWLS